MRLLTAADHSPHGRPLLRIPIPDEARDDAQELPSTKRAVGVRDCVPRRLAAARAWSLFLIRPDDYVAPLPESQPLCTHFMQEAAEIGEVVHTSESTKRLGFNHDVWAAPREIRQARGGENNIVAPLRVAWALVSIGWCSAS